MLLPRQLLASAVALLASSSLVQQVASQAHTDCQPLNVTCPPNQALGTQLYTHFNTTPKAGLWENNVGSVTYDKDAGALFTINKQGDSPTIRSKFYFFWGRSEIWLKASPGKGIVSSIMFLSDDLDEVDWEFIGGDNLNASTNYFGSTPEKVELASDGRRVSLLADCEHRAGILVVCYRANIVFPEAGLRGRVELREQFRAEGRIRRAGYVQRLAIGMDLSSHVLDETR